VKINITGFKLGGLIS